MSYITNQAYLSVGSEITQGKKVLAAAINAKGGTASATESFTELAEAVEEIPNLSDMVKLAGIIAGGNYNKSELQGHNENVKYGKTEIVDSVGAFEIINVPYCFQYWDLLEGVNLPNLTTISGNNVFAYCPTLQEVKMTALTTISGNNVFQVCSSLQEINLPNLTTVSGSNMFLGCSSLQYAIFPKLAQVSGNAMFNYTYGIRYVEFGTLTQLNVPIYNFAAAKLRNVTIGQDTDINLPFNNWTATNVIAEGQSGIDELNSNLYNNLLTKLYDHSSDGQTKTLRIGWLANVTAENIAYANAKGWTLTT